jgi:pimeloyl-ACP methyl ester carboxylesterase
MSKTVSFGQLIAPLCVAALLLCGVFIGQAGAREKGAGGEKRFAKFGDARVHYRSFGRGEEAVVFVHGWTCDWTFWAAQIPAASKAGRVLAVDLPGHGESDAPQGAANYTMDSFARAVEAVMRDAKVRRAVLVGHSMGTPVVRQFYRRSPEKTLGLVFVDGSLWPLAPRAAAESFVAPLRADFARAARPMVEGMTQPMLSAELRGQVRAKMLGARPHVAVAAMEGMLDEVVYKEDPIKVPALAFVARSPFWPADAEQRFRRLAPELDFRLWEGVSHFLMMDRPEDFNRELADFIARRKLLRQK